MLDALQEPGGEYFDWKALDGKFSVDGDLCDITAFAVDPDSIMTGWGKIATGTSPDYRWSEVPNTKTPKPGDDFKPAFHVDVYVTKRGGAPENGWKPWNTTGRASRDALTAIWEEIHDGAKQNPGKIAVLKVDEIINMKYGPAVVKAPKFSLAKWIATPEREEPDSEPTPMPAPPPQPAPAPAPAPAPQPAAAAADDDLF
jgi:hypothetical protein